MEALYLAVARFSKPHGLKGEAVVFVLTDQPEAVFVPGRQVTPVDDEGQPTGPPLTIERARPYHRRWLLKLAEINDRPALEPWRNVPLGVPVAELEAPNDGEMYVHEIAGATVYAGGSVIGTARELMETPGGRLLAVDREGKEVLIPFRKPILVRVDRERHAIEVDPPPGLLELE